MSPLRESIGAITRSKCILAGTLCISNTSPRYYFSILEALHILCIRAPYKFIEFAITERGDSVLEKTLCCFAMSLIEECLHILRKLVGHALPKACMGQLQHRYHVIS